MNHSVDFYVLKDTGVEAGALLACRLAEKAYSHHKTVYIYCAENKIAVDLDKLLWTFKEESFIPHASATAATAADAPIVIGCDTTALNRDYDILINLHPEINPHWQKFSRILDIVANEPLSKELGRQRYKYYREANCQLSLHEL
ncbi:MAG: holC [Gammaproteobacteria bacterium]|jgi:DNA polymerase-3 subunit chi|nr:holC [Gammaproteobacteria bacterium]